jgi:hypothetical protein
MRNRLERHLRRATAIALFLTACGERRPESAGAMAEPIQGGAPDSEHSFAVGVLREREGLGFCSGVLIAPNLVVTARHCVTRMASTSIDCPSTSFGPSYAPEDFRVTIESRIVPDAAFVNVADIIVPRPAAEAFCGNDIAVLRLAENVRAVAFAEPALDGTALQHTLDGNETLAIGYGLDSPEDALGRSIGVRRIKRHLQNACVSRGDGEPACAEESSETLIVSGELMVEDAGACTGDSGSGLFEEPAFERGEWSVLGVLSRGSVSPDGSQCVGSVYSRVDVWASFLSGAAAEGARHGKYGVPAWAHPGSACDDDDCNSAPIPAASCAATIQAPPTGQNAGAFACVLLVFTALGRRRQRAHPPPGRD